MVVVGRGGNCVGGWGTEKVADCVDGISIYRVLLAHCGDWQRTGGQSAQPKYLSTKIVVSLLRTVGYAMLPKLTGGNSFASQQTRR